MESSGAEAAKRYEELGIADALDRHYDYPWACHELSLILRLAYSKLSKNLQSLVFRDTLAAFRLLPEGQTSHGTSSANFLIQAAEASLPKQRRSLAVSEFKHAIVAHKRRGKCCQDGGSMQLPQDVLIHVFSFLDMRSLVNSSLVCRDWYSASADNTLWRCQYSLMFGDYNSETKEQTNDILGEKLDLHPPSPGEDEVSSINWKGALKRKYKGHLAWNSATHRVICSHCKSIIWLSHITNTRSYHYHKLVNQKFTIKPVSVYKVVDYLLGETDFTGSSSSDSDDSDYDTYGKLRVRKLWAYPKLDMTKGLVLKL